MTLDLSNRGPLTPDVFETDEQTGVAVYTYANRIKEQINTLGVCYSERPILSEVHRSIFPEIQPGQYFDGRLPTVIRSLTLDQISILHSLFSNWFKYLKFQTSMVAIERSEAKRQRDMFWSLIRKQYKSEIDQDTGRKRTDQVVSDMARIDYRFVVADARYEELNVLYNILLSQCDMAEHDMSVISREVTIHQMMQGKHAGIDITGAFRSWRSSNESSSIEPEGLEPAKDYDKDRPRPTIPKISR
jgi:hypothetical protein